MGPSKMLASTARNLLGFPEKENGRYNVWRTEIAGFMAQNNIENQTQAGAEKWAEVRDFAISHRYARGYKAGYTKGKNSATLQEALTTILADIRAKESKKRKIAAAEDAARGMGDIDPQNEEEAAAGERRRIGLLPPVGGPRGAIGLASGALLPPPRSVLVHRIDPERGGGVAAVEVENRPWSGRNVFVFPGMIYAHTVADLLSLGLRHLDIEPGSPPRRVRNLLGAINNSRFNPLNKKEMVENPDFVMLTQSEDVEAWLDMTEAKPLRLLVILERLPPPAGIEAPQTPPPDDWSHIDNDAYQTILEPQDASSNDEGPITKRRRLPASEKTFRRRLQKLRLRRNRISEHVAEMEEIFHERFPGPGDGQEGGEEGEAAEVEAEQALVED
jgi:hypothetical protein